MDRRYFLFEASPEVPVRLVADVYVHRRGLIGFANRLDVYTVDSTRRTEVGLPHFQATAAVDSDLNNVHLGAPKAAEMGIINIEIVIPFPYPASFFAGIEEFAQRIRFYCRANAIAVALPVAVCAPHCAATPCSPDAFPKCAGLMPTYPSFPERVAQHVPLHLTDVQGASSTRPEVWL